MADTPKSRPSSTDASPAAHGKRTPMYTLAQFRAAGDLGAGSFGTVRRVVHEDTGEVFAMKVLEKERVVQRDLQEQLKREVLTQLRVKHPNVVRLHYYFEDAARIYCLLECADGGQLFAYLRKQQGGVPEARAAQLFGDTAKGLAYLHSLRIAHRDLKPENILLFGPALRAKIGDFGWCVELTPEAPSRRTFCGTLDYLAPEMLTSSPHDTTVDLWALGVLLYEMLLAKAPFTSTSQKETVDRICAVRFDVPRGSMSTGPEALVRGLLVLQGSCRMPLSKVLQHQWLVANTPASQPGVGQDDAVSLDVTKAAPRRGAPAAATSVDDSMLLEATRQAPRREGARGPGQERAGKGAVDTSLVLDTTVTVQRRQARPRSVAAAAGPGASPASPGAGDALLDTTHVVKRRPAEAKPVIPNHSKASLPALGGGPSGSPCGRGLTPSANTPSSCTSSTASSRPAPSGNLDDTDPSMPALEAVPKDFAFTSATQAAREGAWRGASRDGRLSKPQDETRISLEDLDGRFLGGGGAGTPLHPKVGHEADFWVVRTEQVASCNPRPKVRSRRGGVRVMEI